MLKNYKYFCWSKWITSCYSVKFANSARLTAGTATVILVPYYPAKMSYF